MSVQDKVERVLREFHVMVSKGEPYGNNSEQVIIEKQKALELLNELAYAMSDMLEAYEMTTRSRDKKEREAKRRGEEIVRHANHAAEDVYAASVLYSDEALERIQRIMQDANEEMDRIFDNFRKELKGRQRIVRENQLELKATLENLKDTDKYNRIIEERNKEIEKEKDPKNKKKAAGKNGAEMKIFPAGKPDIKINPAYFEKTGKPMPVEVEKDEAEEVPELKVMPEIKVNLDAEYFRWKQNQQKKKAD